MSEAVGRAPADEPEPWAGWSPSRVVPAGPYGDTDRVVECLDCGLEVNYRDRSEIDESHHDPECPAREVDA